MQTFLFRLLLMLPQNLTAKKINVETLVVDYDDVDDVEGGDYFGS